ncbi:MULTISPECIES: hypothetical protein [Metabacillus]|uniref:Uncharacterized protein n=1 Tax=Metabacillus hrfriensis TaxID=3048891 RepID=A0ACD4R9I6_9BACI|nr:MULTISPECIES: hypothetical protein [Metabacillus]UAL51602.1 hypothetical protein K8L98_20860 [Metabacillus dongyingensis]USK27908.1 hypothetical protein LIT32_21030 [Bacillus sp. CMF21]WHZ57116.1 hypothetical protein QLQ22_21015 [Metabacillus sp. CT-WN-B3]
MQVFATFDHCTYLELAISQMEQEGIPKEKILAVSLNTTDDSMKLMDSIHHSDGVSLFDTGAALATAFAVIGVSIGFRLAWGPVYWGLIGACSGLLLGFLLNFFYYCVIKKKKLKPFSKKKETEVVIVIECHEDFHRRIQQVLLDNYAIAIGFVK